MYLTPQSVLAWSNGDKVTWATSIDTDLDSQIASQVLAKAARAFDITSWVDKNTTPQLILSIIAMNYAGRKFQEMYGEDSLNSDYGTALITDANNMLENLISGDLILLDEDLIPTESQAVGTVTYEPTESNPMFYVEMRF
ncbi:MAG TPA: hypothetical protein PKJ52_01360 [Rectinema sp.]|nr:hypothetical protein [Rectinema sp.]